MRKLINKIKNWFKPKRYVEKYYILDEYKNDENVIVWLDGRKDNSLGILTEVYYYKATQMGVYGYVELWRGSRLLDRVQLKKGEDGLIIWDFN